MPTMPYSLIVFNDPQHCYVATFHNNGRIALHSPVDSASLSRFQIRYKSLLVRNHITAIDTLGSVSRRVIPMVLSDGTRILYVNSLGTAPPKDKLYSLSVAPPRVKVDWVILSNRYCRAIADLSRRYEFSRVMLASDIYLTERKKYTDEVDSLNRTRHNGDKITLYDVANQGAYIRLLSKSE